MSQSGSNIHNDFTNGVNAIVTWLSQGNKQLAEQKAKELHEYLSAIQPNASVTRSDIVTYLVTLSQICRNNGIDIAGMLGMNDPEKDESLQLQPALR